MWHLDGYDKLKPYGFAVHCCVDGYVPVLCTSSVYIYRIVHVCAQIQFIMIVDAVVVQKSAPNTAGLPGGIKELVDACIQRPPLNRPTFGDVLRMLNALKK